MAASPPKKKSQVITLAAGGMGGCLDALITMPLDTVKTYVQVNKGETLGPFRGLLTAPRRSGADVKGMAAGASSIMKNKGPLGFYFGLPAMIAQVPAAVLSVDAAFRLMTVVPGWDCFVGLIQGRSALLRLREPQDRPSGLR